MIKHRHFNSVPARAFARLASPAALAIGLFFALVISVAPATARLADGLVNFTGYNTDSLPLRLSQTGLYTALPTKGRAVTAGITAFEVNSPLWSDGAHKERYVTVPANAKITPTDSDGYIIPDKTVFVKNFQIDTVYGDSLTRVYIETRFLVVHEDNGNYTYNGVTYKWRKDQSDADLVGQSDGLDTVFNVKLGGTLRGKRWHYPTKSECRNCHINRGVLGFLTPQLNRPSKANASINQLQALFTANILSANPLTGKPTPTFRWVGLDETGAVTAEQKVRSYFASNCSQCHGNGNQPDGTQHNFDYFKATTKITADVPGGYVGLKTGLNPAFPQVIYAGYPESSYVMGRMTARGVLGTASILQMPPLATYQIDSAAVKVVKDWICSLGKRGAACKLPDAQADATFWDTPTAIGPHRLLASGFASLQPTLLGRVLTLPGASDEKVFLYDYRGTAVDLTPMGRGRYQVPARLPRGIYFLRRGGALTRISYLP